MIVAALVVAWALPAGAGELKLVLPSWAVDPPVPRKPPRVRARTKVVDAVRVVRGKRGRRPRRPKRAGPLAKDEAEATYAALKLLRVNQGAMQVCDRIASRHGDGAPRRVRFLVQVNGAGAARVAVDSPVPLGAAATRCYRASAARLAYPRTGAPYTLVLSRISGRATN